MGVRGLGFEVLEFRGEEFRVCSYTASLAGFLGLPLWNGGWVAAFGCHGMPPKHRFSVDYQRWVL